MPRRQTSLSIGAHEAGHAIVQLAHGSHPWIEYISVGEQHDDTVGRVRTTCLWQKSNLAMAADRAVHESWSAAAYRDVVVHLAGPVAELRWRRNGRAAIWLGAEDMARHCLDERHEDFSDFGRVRERLEWAVPGDDHANFVKAWLEAEEEVARWWPEITALGRMVAARGRIEDEELYSIWRGMRTGKVRGGRRAEPNPDRAA